MHGQTDAHNPKIPLSVHLLSLLYTVDTTSPKSTNNQN